MPLDRDVERRRRLVGDDQVGLVQQSDGDRDALTHAAGELMRIRRQALFRRWNADLRKRCGSHRVRVAGADLPVRNDRFDHLRVDAQDRIQRHHRVLEDHRHAIPAHLSHVLPGKLDDIDPIQKNASANDTSRRIDETHDRITGHRLARAGFADKAHDLAAIDDERYVVDRFHHAGLREEMRAETFD